MRGAGRLGLAEGTLRLVPHDPAWARRFQEEGARLAVLDVELHHIGSTAVPGLPAKPILDMMIVAPETRWPALRRAMAAAGYRDKGRRDMRGRHVLDRLDGVERTHLVQFYPPGHLEIAEHLDFRDALRTDPSARAIYAQAKATLIARGVARRDYAAAKTATVRGILDAWRAAPRPVDPPPPQR